MLRAILVDSREPKEFQAIDLGVPVIVQELQAGDVWLACDDAHIIVERKTLPDLLASISDERLFNQASEMPKHSPWCYVLITEWPDVSAGFVQHRGESTHWLWSRVQGALLTVQDLGVSVVWCAGEQDYPATLRTLADRKRDDVRLHARRKSTQMPASEQILSALPGIADGRAHALIEHCGSAAWALSYLTDETNTDKVPGVGPMTRAMVRGALGLEEGFALYPLHKADTEATFKAREDKKNGRK